MHPALPSAPPLPAADLVGPAVALNARWAAERFPYRLDRRGVADLWAVYRAGTELQPPLLFIVGHEPHAVRQAERWADAARERPAAAAA